MLAAAASAPLARAEWTPPDLEPPGCDSGTPGCDAPLNVSSVTQIKTGGIAAGVIRSFTDLIVDNDLVVSGAGSIDGGLIMTGPATSTIVKTTSTTASSTFANGINLTKGCFAINGICITGGSGGGGSSQWSSSGANIYFGGGSVGVSDGYSFGSASSSALAYYLPYNANATNPKGEISFRSTGTTGVGTFNIGGYYNMGSGWNYRNFLAFNHNGLYPFIDINQPIVFNSDAIFSEGTTINASAADAFVAPLTIYDGSITNYLTVGDSNFDMNLYAAGDLNLNSSGGSVIVYKAGGGVIGVDNDINFSVPSGRSFKFSAGNVGIGANNPAFLLDVGTTTSGRIGVGGTQVISKPDQTNYLGTLIYGDGGGKLAHAAGSEGFHNSIFGMLAGNALTTGADNTLFGWRAGRANQTGNNNTAFGTQALEYNTASNNTGFGFSVLSSNTSGTSNTAIGVNSLNSNQTGTDNVGIGVNTLRLVNGNYNMALGTEALNVSRTGSSNIGIGYRASYLNYSATNTTAIGFQAARGNTFNSQYYTCIGSQACGNYLTGNDAGAFTTAIGANAGFSLTTAQKNVLIGYQAGDAITTGSQNIVIGYDIDAPVDTGSNQISIGNLIFGTGATATGKTVSTGKVGIGIAAPATTLDVNGLIRAYQTSTTTCDASVEGSIFYNGTAGNKHFYGCNGSAWRQLDN
jgi:hypothetical protein